MLTYTFGEIFLYFNYGLQFSFLRYLYSLQQNNKKDFIDD